MMRAMYSAVSGLKTHQTKMDVIGNNIANVNTVAFKSSSVTFQDMLYQNLSGASGANAITGVGGVNAKQVGLGVTTGATNISIEDPGAAETTGRGFDLRLTDMNSTNFFIVNNGSENVFTRSGSFYVDGAGNLAMTSTGYTVMGWQVDPVTGEIVKDTVSALRIMKPENMTSPPEATTDATMSGVIDKNDPDVSSDTGLIKNLNFYDKQGYSYTARFSIKKVDDKGNFTVELDSILDSNGKASGLFPNGNFENITIDFSKTQNTNNGGKSTVTMDTGNVDNPSLGKGKKLGDMIGLSVDNNGKIYGTYDNGNTELLGQIAVAQFANASGLEKIGENCYATTLNSGEFDGIGREIQADGSKMTSGELEMSNVDLSQEFTQMITTQRGFQANSRVITTSDTLLEELVNLKR